MSVSDRFRVVGMAIVTSLVFFFVARAFGANLLVQMGPGGSIEDMGWINVLLVTVSFGVLALALAWILDRYSWGKTVWTVVAAVMLVASFGVLGPLFLSTADLIWQALLHSVFGLLMIIGFYVGWPEPD